MGEEEKNLQSEQEQEVKEETSPAPEEQESNVVKILRKKLEKEIEENKKLRQTLEEYEEALKIANLEELSSKIERIEFENQILKKYPHLATETEDILRVRKPGENIDETVAKYVGMKALQGKEGFSIGSAPLSPNLQAAPEEISKLPKEEQEKIARELFKRIYGSE